MQTNTSVNPSRYVCTPNSQLKLRIPLSSREHNRMYICIYIYIYLICIYVQCIFERNVRSALLHVVWRRFVVMLIEMALHHVRFCLVVQRRHDDEFFTVCVGCPMFGGEVHAFHINCISFGIRALFVQLEVVTELRQQLCTSGIFAPSMFMRSRTVNEWIEYAEYQHYTEIINEYTQCGCNEWFIDIDILFI